MDSALLSLLGAFLLSLIGLFAFIWTSRQGLMVENPRAASVIFAPGEIGQIDDPALPAGEQGAMQAAVAPRGDPVVPADLTEHADRIAADRSTAFPVFVFLAFACFWLLVGSVAGLVASIKLHHPDWLVDSRLVRLPGRHRRQCAAGSKVLSVLLHCRLRPLYKLGPTAQHR